MGDHDFAGIGRGSKESPFLNTRQAAHYLGLSPRHLERMRSRGEGPPFRRHSRFIRYHIDELDDWSQASRPGTADG